MTWLQRSPDSTLVLWLIQETVHRLHLVVLNTMRPAIDPAGHRVPRTNPTCLLHTWRPHQLQPFALVLHMHQHESSRNLHLQYLAKNQCTQCCQSLITPGSDHPPVLEPHMVLNRSAFCKSWSWLFALQLLFWEILKFSSTFHCLIQSNKGTLKKFCASAHSGRDVTPSVRLSMHPWPT
jgi:hypothetical protein